MKRTILTAASTLLLGFSAAASAAVTAEEAKQLGTTLTPWGAEQAGNKEGTIPAYGKDAITTPPAGYNPSKPGILPDPFASEKPLYTVTASNMDKHATHLTDGVAALLKKYPTMRMDVYPTHRTAVYPKYVIENTLKNATSCKSGKDGLKLDGCYGGLPFPIPSSGVEVVWNKLVRYTSESWSGTFSSWLVPDSGSPILQAENLGWQSTPYYNPKRTGQVAPDETYFRLRADTTNPARKSGEKVLVIDNIDSVSIGRRAYQYLPGQRRVKLSPDLAYDTPNPQSGGVSTMDEAQGFFGAPDRYEWKLVGKKEILLPYNNFKYFDPGSCPAKVKLTKNHPNPDCIRWELHRTWVVEGTLKPGFRHIYRKRTFYIDEDAPGAMLADAYDNSGAMFRVTFVPFYPMYTSQGLMADVSITMDLTSRSWMTSADATDNGGWFATPEKGDRFYSPESMAADGIR